MNHPSLTILRRTAFVCAVLLSTSSHARAGISFTQQGNDLILTLTAPIHFTVTSPDDTNVWGVYGVAFHDVYSVPTFTHTQQAFPTQGNSTMTIPGSGVSNFYGSWERGWGVTGYGSRDFVANYGFNQFQPVNVGDNVTVSLGSVTVPNFFSTGMTLPDLPPTTAVLIAGNGKVLSDAAVIPEPAHTALGLAAGALLLGLLRRRQRSMQPVKTC
jgi:hypothetical protein